MQKSRIPMYEYNKIIELSNTIDCRLADYQKKSIEIVLGNRYHNQDIKRYFHTSLCYCPECIKVGYHSWFHQSIFVSKCPIHQIPLKYRCPNCNQPISFDPEITKRNAAFSCACGYSFLESTSWYQLLADWKGQKMTNEILSCNYEEVSLKDKGFIALYYYSASSMQKQEVISIPVNTRDIKTIAEVAAVSTVPENDSLFQGDIFSSLLESYNITLKSVAKHLRKMTPAINYRLKSLKGIITYELSHEGKLNKDDKLVYAYLM